jgi:hypothetical protein
MGIRSLISAPYSASSDPVKNYDGAVMLIWMQLSTMTIPSGFFRFSKEIMSDRHNCRTGGGDAWHRFVTASQAAPAPAGSLLRWIPADQH